MHAAAMEGARFFFYSSRLHVAEAFLLPVFLACDALFLAKLLPTIASAARLLLALRLVRSRRVLAKYDELPRTAARGGDGVSANMRRKLAALLAGPRSPPRAWRTPTSETSERLLGSTLRWAADGTLVQLAPPAHKGGYHLFLSHLWKHGQDTAGTLKSELKHVLPTCAHPMTSPPPWALSSTAVLLPSLLLPSWDPHHRTCVRGRVQVHHLSCR
jgi:hypothetical protein